MSHKNELFLKFYSGLFNSAKMVQRLILMNLSDKKLCKQSSSEAVGGKKKIIF